MTPDTPVKKQESEDEIDLGKLFEKIGNFILNTLLLFVKNLKALTAFILAGILISLIYFYQQQSVYITEMTISSRFLSNEFCAELISNINKLVGDGNHNQLAHLLKVDKELVKNLRKIEYKNFNEKYEKLEEDTVLLRVPFKVKVEVSGNKVLDTLGGSLAYYFKTNEYAKRRETVELENLKKQIEILSIQNQDLDSLKQIAAKSMLPRGSKDAIVYGEPYDPVNIYKQQVEFYKSEVDLRRQLVESEKAVEIIQPFTKFRNPLRPIPWEKCIVVGIVSGLLLGLLFVLLKELVMAVKSFERKKLIMNKSN